MVRLDNTNVRYVGLSGDVKPAAPGDTKAGAAFHEEDTGRDFVFDGFAWFRVVHRPGASEATLRALMESVLLELRAIRMGQEVRCELEPGELVGMALEGTGEQRE